MGPVVEGTWETRKKSELRSDAQAGGVRYMWFRSLPHLSGVSGEEDQGITVGALALFEDGLGDQAVDSLGSVYGLSHVEIYGRAGEHVRVFASQVLLGYQEVDGFADGHFQGFGEVGVQTHGDEVGRGLSPGRFQVEIFADDEFEGPGE